jgi:hypothetical protein
MIRRWLIRALALTLLTLCAVAWVGSYSKMVGYNYAAKNWYSVIWANGRVSFAVVDAAKPGFNVKPPPKGSSFTIRAPSALYWDYYGRLAEYQFVGFVAHRGYDSYIIIPLWFPTLLSAALLWLVWRKTRPNYNGRGFPVEPARKEATTP